MPRALVACGVAALLAAAAPAVAAASPSPTCGRQLELAAAHLLATAADHHAELPPVALAELSELATVTRGFRWILEASTTVVELERARAELIGALLAARAALPAELPRPLHHEVLRVHSLVNRIDRDLGGSGVWYGRHGFSG